ncbi:TIGR03618 family F420-dependent PPOX class oxidoreductase [Mycolicibacterium vaccae]|uniref:TIGR03618 family F420-dependent PPOX class oxidoreductase n=1 Tax=Mycolicibacterium vaccae TaxID=1810 RepID=UPI003CE6BA7E
MGTFVISGGTDGIGKAIAVNRLRLGHEVVVIGRDAAKGEAFLESAVDNGAGGRAHFVLADLSVVAQTRQAIDEIKRRVSKVDGLVLCARHYQTVREVTSEGLEHTFALYYLSRFLLSYRMIDLLDAADAPVIVNVSGPGSGTDSIRWDDLGGERSFDPQRILTQGGQLNDLLGIGFARRRPSPKVRYVLLHPGVVNTGFSGVYDAETAAQIEQMRSSAQPVQDAIVPILDILDHPPTEPLTAVTTGGTLDVHGPAFDAVLADRLYAETTTLLGRFASAAMGVSPSRLRQVLDAPVFATVATVDPDGRPHQSVVWVTRDGEDVLFAIATGSRKERNLRRDSRVSVLLSPPDEPYTYAAIYGTATLSAEGGHELRDALAVKYTGRTYAEGNADASARYGDLEMTVVRVTPDRVVGRL